MSNERKEPITDETVFVEMRGPSGNAYCVMANVVKALKDAGRGDLKDEYLRRATSGNYENLLAVSGEYVNIERI